MCLGYRVWTPAEKTQREGSVTGRRRRGFCLLVPVVFPSSPGGASASSSPGGDKNPQENKFPEETQVERGEKVGGDTVWKIFSSSIRLLVSFPQSDIPGKDKLEACTLRGKKTRRSCLFWEL